MNTFSALGGAPLGFRQQHDPERNFRALRQRPLFSREWICNPPDRSQAIFPSVLTFQWSNASLDEAMAFALRNMSGTIHAAALADGQNVSHAAVYVNYALFGTPLKEMYGGNVERLRKIRAAIDPEDVMGLTGGWKF